MTQPIRSMPELVDALRRRHEELDISFATIDEIAGVQTGYASKLLAPNPTKNLGWMSLGSILGALGVAVVVVEDPEAVKTVEKRWQRRKRPQKLIPALASRFSIEHEVPKQIAITPDLQAQITMKERMKMLGKRGGKIGGKRRLKTMGKRARQRAASHAARIRWGKRAIQ